MTTPTTKRRVIVELNGNGDLQEVVDYCSSFRSETLSRDVAVLEHISRLDFEPLEGESSYRGWSRCVINISGPLCIADGCEEALDYSYDTEKETQICYDCSDFANEEEE
jgi:hypothetical protein